MKTLTTFCLLASVGLAPRFAAAAEPISSATLSPADGGPSSAPAFWTAASTSTHDRAVTSRPKGTGLLIGGLITAGLGVPTLAAGIVVLESYRPSRCMEAIGSPVLDTSGFTTALCQANNDTSRAATSAIGYPLVIAGGVATLAGLTLVTVGSVKRFGSTTSMGDRATTSPARLSLSVGPTAAAMHGSF